MFFSASWGQCRVEAGLQRSELLVEQDFFWIEGHIGTHNLKSVNLGREWIRREPTRDQLKKEQC